MWLHFVLLCLCPGFLYAEDTTAATDKDGVYQLTDENLDQFLEEAEVSLIKFYAPWCAHCVELAPEFGRAARELKPLGINLGEVNVVTEKELADEFDVKVGSFISNSLTETILTSSFLLYMPVFAALAGGKVALYHPLKAPAGGKVLYRPLEQFFWCQHFFLRKIRETS
jgi:thiol-disulfide isomerase/thioredoxin